MDVYCRVKRRRFVILIGFAIVFAFAGSLAAPCVGEPSNVRPYLPCPDEWLAEAGFFVDRGLIPSVLILVETPEWGLRVGTVGHANLATSEPPDPSMYYRVGGMTQLMLAAVILQLEHEGKITLDHTIDRLLGEGLVPNGDKISLRDCLMMRSGLFDYTKSDTFKSPAKLSSGEFQPEEILYRVRESLRKDSGAPGEVFYQSDTGFLLAGIVVEKIEQKKLSQVFNERIFKPLKMNDSFYAVSPGIPDPVVHGYEYMSEIPVDCTVYDPSILGAASAVVSTPFDMFSFFRELFEGRRLLSKRSYRLMATLANAIHEEDAYGMGLMERVSRRGTWRGGETSIRGYSVMAGYYMLGDAYIMIFVNTGENLFAVEEIFRNTLRRISGCPNDMSPENNARLNAGSGRVRLSWQSGFLYGDTYRIYVGTNRDMVRNATPDNLDGVTMVETDSHTFHTSVKLKSGRTYYWRVEAFRNRPELDMQNARKWRDQVRENNQQMPWVSVPETEQISGPVYSFTLH